MTTPETVLRLQDTTLQSDMCMSLELSDKTWRLTFGDGRRAPSHCTVTAGDQAAVLEHIARAKRRFGLPPDAKVHSCYEAGRDGWWLHRWLTGQGIDNIVVDAASIEVNRRARRAKNDRLDGDKLLTMLQRWRAGETRVWSVLREPSVEHEDARRVHREFGDCIVAGEDRLDLRRLDALAPHLHLPVGAVQEDVTPVRSAPPAPPWPTWPAPARRCPRRRHK